MNSIFTRTSVRSYTEQAVEPEKVEKLLRAAMAAPSATNQQPWEFYVVTDREKLDRMGESRPYWRMLKEAPLAIVPCIQRDCKRDMYAPTDLALATENIMLEAVELGLGSVMLGTYPVEERVRFVADTLAVPDSLIPFTVLSIGYPAEQKPQQDRYDEARVHRV